jgi:hypothetical protein
MYAGWMFAGALLGAIAAIIVWVLLIALVVTWVEDRHRHRHAP